MLDIQDITQVFGGLVALDNVSFTAHRGDITGVIGPNGAGKTTLFNIISGIYRQTSGAILLENRNISGLPPEKLAKYGIVRTFQNIELFGQMTVLENVMVGLHSRSSSGILACSFKMPWHLSE
jgi:branched-chain amino acid transport system ATP-binding protein